MKFPFTEAGRYIGYVRAEPRVGGPIEAVFPFAVGRGSKQWRIYVAVIVGTAFAGAMAIRAWLGPERLRHSAMRLDGLSVIVLMIFAIPLMDGIVARAHADPFKLAGFVAGAFAGMILCNALMAAVTLPFLDRRTALTAGYCSGGRHNALLMAVLPLTVDPDIFLFIAAVQVPIYIIPTVLQPMYRRLLPENTSS